MEDNLWRNVSLLGGPHPSGSKQTTRSGNKSNNTRHRILLHALIMGMFLSETHFQWSKAASSAMVVHRRKLREHSFSVGYCALIPHTTFKLFQVECNYSTSSCFGFLWNHQHKSLTLQFRKVKEWIPVNAHERFFPEMYMWVIMTCSNWSWIYFIAVAKSGSNPGQITGIPWCLNQHTGIWVVLWIYLERVGYSLSCMWNLQVLW